MPCGCGDTVTADHRLRDDLGPCPGHGLIVKSGARLDCGGRSIVGLRDGSEQYGILLDGRPRAEVTGVTVANCHVSGFLRGIRLRAARGNTIAGNVITGNGNFKTHVGYGIDVAGESIDNLIEKNRVQQSADEGVHIGRGSHGNRLVGNEITDSHRESLYVLASDRGLFLGNTLGGSGAQQRLRQGRERQPLREQPVRGPAGAGDRHGPRQRLCREHVRGRGAPFPGLQGRREPEPEPRDRRRHDRGARVLRALHQQRGQHRGRPAHERLSGDRPRGVPRPPHAEHDHRPRRRHGRSGRPVDAPARPAGRGARQRRGRPAGGGRGGHRARRSRPPSSGARSPTRPEPSRRSPSSRRRGRDRRRRSGRGRSSCERPSRDWPPTRRRSRPRARWPSRSR